MSSQAPSHPLRLVRVACRDCRHPTPQVVTPCVHCGAPLPRLRLNALSWWMALAVGIVVLAGIVGAGHPASFVAAR